MFEKNELVMIFKALNPETQVKVWRDFSFDDKDEGTPAPTDLTCVFIDFNNEEFWEFFEDLCNDNEENIHPCVEAIRMASISKNYRWDNKFVRFVYDNEVKDCVLWGSDSIVELMGCYNGTPVVETDEFTSFLDSWLQKHAKIETKNVLVIKTDIDNIEIETKGENK